MAKNSITSGMLEMILMKVTDEFTEALSTMISIAAPTIWNRVPADVQTSNSVACFKSRLKTFLFRTVYNC